jgi:multiple sugar transport system substrate-binding protein
MRKRTTWAAAASAALLIGTALAACSGGGGTSGGGSSTLTVEDYYQSPNDKVMEGVYNACGKTLGVTIKTTHVPGAGLIAKVLQQASAKNMPDVLMLDNPDVQQIAASGALSPLKDYGLSGKGFAPAVVKAGTYKGDLYGLAPAVNSLALFYNTDMLTKAGITPPKTWDELQADAKKLTSNGVYGFAFSGINTYEGSWQFLPYMWTNGGDEKNIDTPETTQALQFVTDLMKDGSISKSAVNWSQSDVLDQFTAGKAAMMENGPWNFGALKKFPDVHWATAPMPTRTASQTAVAPLGGEAFTVPETGNKDTMANAGKLVKCITSAKNQITIANAEGDVPANLATAQKVGESNKLIAPFVEVVSHARARTGELGADWPKAATKIYTAEQLALTGKATPAAALKQAQNSN